MLIKSFTCVLDPNIERHTLLHQIKGGLYLTGLKLKRGLINVLQGKKVFKETLINVQT